MADLIAQGPELSHRWRRTLSRDKPVLVGRQSVWSVPWDDRISREHVQLLWNGETLAVEARADARNPIFIHGKECPSFNLRPGEHFVIGSTTFSLSDDHVNVSLDAPQPMQEQAYSAQYLKRMRFRNADQRIENLSRLPEIISGASTDAELFTRVVNVLLSGVPSADAAAIVAVDQNTLERRTQILHWDQRRLASGKFQPSERLIHEAVRRSESVLHVWNVRGGNQAFTESENYDWAFCTPVPGEACRGFGIYLAGRFMGDPPLSPAPSDPTDLRDDLKFTEIAASTLASLTDLRALGKRHAGLSQFFSPVVLEALAVEDPQIALAPREAQVSVLFCDLRGFSLTSEHAAGDLLGLLERVSKALGVMTHEILDHGGVVGDFHGDAAMGFWGWPVSASQDARQSCLAALRIRAEFATAARQADPTLADFQVGIGLATGRAVAGRIGSADQAKVTVFGPVVNLASRLEGMTKMFRASILLDAQTAAAIRDSLPPDVVRVRRVARVRPFGMDTSVDVSELVQPAADFPELTDEAIADYERALTAFEAGRWSQSFELLHRVPAADRLKDFLTVYIAQHNRTPPPGWDGVITLTNK
ncbi:MAG: adenylate/guanylate cyclase domain-containing protein [Pirellulales bacterium]